MSRLAIYNPAVKVLSNFTARSSGLTINASLLMNQENVFDTSPDETLCCKQMPDCMYAVKAQHRILWMSPDTNFVCSFTSGWSQYEARPDLLWGGTSKYPTLIGHICELKLDLIKEGDAAIGQVLVMLMPTFSKI